jgi:hypothetical protein
VWVSTFRENDPLRFRKIDPPESGVRLERQVVNGRVRRFVRDLGLEPGVTEASDLR